MSDNNLHPVPGRPFLKTHRQNNITLKTIWNGDISKLNINQELIDLLNFYGNTTPVMRYGEIKQPLVISKFTDSDKTNIITEVYIFDNCNKELQIENLDIYQNFIQALDGKHQISYHISYKRSESEYSSEDYYYIYKLTICNKDIGYYPFSENPSTHDTSNPRTLEKIKLGIIQEVIVFINNVNPRTSRGTVTTVKNASGG